MLCDSSGNTKMGENFMNKKLLTAVSAVVISMGMASVANAGCDGIYVGVRGGIINHNIGDNDETFGDRYDVDDNSLIAAIALGYRYGYLRAELEYTWREKTDTGTGFGTGADFESDSYMLNFYVDLSPYTMFTPYLMAGLGYSNLDASTTSMWFGQQKKTSYSEGNFTWAVGGGLSAQVTTRINADIGYRFLNMGDIEHASVRAHEFYIGARYVF